MLKVDLGKLFRASYDLVRQAFKVSITDGTNSADVMATNGSHGLVTIEPNHISTNNSTTDLLGIDGVFTGIGEDITNYAIMFINVYSDVASATDGLCIQASHDGIDWHLSECYTILAGKYKVFAHQCNTKYFRIVYTNGGIAQTDFHIEVKLCTKNALASSHRIADSISEQDDATLNKSVLTAQQPSSAFVNVGATANGNLKVTDAENTLAIAKGLVEGHSVVQKFGNAKDFDTSDGEVTCWDGAENGELWTNFVYDYSTTADIDSISSSSASDTIAISIVGLDANYNQVTQTITLQGQTRVALTTPLIRVFRGYNANGTNLIGHVVVYPNTPLTTGVPTDKSKIRLIIDPLNQQTLMSIYTIPAGKTGYLTRGYASTSGASKSSNYIIRFIAREFGGVFRTQNINSISDTGNGIIVINYDVPLKIPEKTDLEVRVQATAVGASGCSVSSGFDLILVDN